VILALKLGKVELSQFVLLSWILVKTAIDTRVGPPLELENQQPRQTSRHFFKSTPMQAVSVFIEPLFGGEADLTYL
jgi:hypothetical protein